MPPLEGVAGLPFTARIERAPSHRARSASKKGTWLLPPHSSETARCASTGDSPSHPLLLMDCFSILSGLLDRASAKPLDFAPAMRTPAPKTPLQRLAVQEPEGFDRLYRDHVDLIYRYA